MADKRTYREVVIALETHMDHIREDITEIKVDFKEAKKQEGNQDKAITRNATNISWIVKIGTGVAFIILTILAIAANLVKIF